MSLETAFAALVLLVAGINIAGYFRIRSVRSMYGLPDMTPSEKSFDDGLAIQMSR